MLKTTKTKLEIVIHEYYCDFCKEKIASKPENYPTYIYTGQSCEYCKRLTCKKCGHYEKIDIDTGEENISDYTSYICDKCLKIANKYYEKIREIRANADYEVNELQLKMKEECTRLLKI